MPIGERARYIRSTSKRGSLARPGSSSDREVKSRTCYSRSNVSTRVAPPVMG